MFEKNSVPAIAYDREELWEIIEELPVDKEKLVQLGKYLDSVEAQLAIIRSSQSREATRQALSEIHQFIDSLYNETRYDHPSLANTLKNVLLGWISPLEKFIGKPKSSPNQPVKQLSAEELELKTKLLYAEQSYVTRQAHLHEAFIKHLHQIKVLLTESSRNAPHRCYIVYSPPTGGSKAQEYWVEPFLGVLYEHLTAAGIRVVMDLKDLKAGENAYRFMDQYNEGNDIILIGTESLNYCYESTSNYPTKTALAILSNVLKTDNSKIYPILISGTEECSFPMDFNFGMPIANGYDGYIATVKNLVDWLLKHRITHKKQPYDHLWNEFIKGQQKLPENVTAINQEISLGFHLCSSSTDFSFKFFSQGIPTRDETTKSLSAEYNSFL